MARVWIASLSGVVSNWGSAPIFVGGALTAAAVLLLFVGMQRTLGNRANSVAKQLDRLGVYEPAPAASRLEMLTQRARHRPRPVYSPTAGGSKPTYTQKLARDFAQADLKITVGEYLVLTSVLASLGAIVGFALPIGGHVVLGAVLLVVGLYGPRIYVTRRKRRRMRAFNAQLADMVALMSGALRSGYSLAQAMDLAAREGPAPAGPEFERVVREIALGLTPEEAFGNLIVRMESEDLVLLVTALNVQREVGGNLVEVLETIANTIRERTKLVGEVRVLTAQQQYSGYLIALLPVALSVMLTIINPNYILSVFKDTTWCGWTMAGCSGAMIFTGFLIIRKIVDIKV